MIDLGQYAFEVLSSYGVSLAMLAALIGLTWRRARAVRRALERAEGGE